jgi:hypothetical protein
LTGVPLRVARVGLIARWAQSNQRNLLRSDTLTLVALTFS